jgi:hypothetical protein
VPVVIDRQPNWADDPKARHDYAVAVHDCQAC